MQAEEGADPESAVLRRPLFLRGAASPLPNC